MNPMRFWKAVFSLLALAIGLWVLVSVSSVLIPFLLGVMIAYLIHPLVDRFVAVGFRRDRTVVVLYLTFLGATCALVVWLLPLLIRETKDIIQQLPAYEISFNSMIQRFNAEQYKFTHHALGKKAPLMVLTFNAGNIVDLLLHKIPENALGFAHIGMWLLIIPFVSFFALSNGRDWIDMIFDWTPSEYVESLLGFLAEVNATLGGYVRGQILDAMCAGFATMIGLMVLGFDWAVLMGLISGLLNVVPFMAPVIGGSLTLLLAYFQGLPTATLIGIVWVFVLVRLLDDFVFIPFIIGGSVKLHPVLMLFAVLAGFQVGGFLGLVFAVPLAAVVKIFVLTALNRKQSNLVLQNHQVIS